MSWGVHLVGHHLERQQLLDYYIILFECLLFDDFFYLIENDCRNDQILWSSFSYTRFFNSQFSILNGLGHDWFQGSMIEAFVMLQYFPKLDRLAILLSRLKVEGITFPITLLGGADKAFKALEFGFYFYS